MDILTEVDYAYYTMIHTLRDKNDWEYISPKHYNTWQKIAAITRGFITPANFASLLGLALVLIGLHELVDKQYLIGSILLGLGRLCDLLDGTLAEYTGTKSRVGETLDATTDKVAIFISAIVIVVNELTPWYLIGAIIVINVVNVCISIVARARYIVIHPSKAGKFFTAASWVLIVMYIYSYALSGIPQDIVRGIAYASYAITTTLGVYAIYGYTLLAITQKPVKNKTVYDQVLIVQNPNSSHAKRAMRRERELKRMFDKEKVQIIPTTKNDAYKKTLQKTLEKSSGNILLCIGGGDGTVHHVANVALTASTKATITLLPLWGGNANDFAYMLNGLSVRKKLAHIITYGHTIDIHPLEITTKHKTSNTTYAICYASFGASAYAAHHLDQVSLSRKGRFHNVPLLLMLRETLQVGRALLQAPTFSAEIKGQKVKIFEQVFTNGSRIAKIDRMPVRLTDKEFYRAVQPAERPDIRKRLAQALSGKPFGTVTKKPHSFTTKEPVLAQFDGEVTQLPTDTVVTVALSQTNIRALSVKL
jgi:phosphatidylglycerophosphate synthase/diacylglycerol kinase family enzyme